MRLRIKLIGTIGASIFSLATNAQLSQDFSLTQAKEYALDHHARVIKANYDVDIATLQKKQAIGLGLPQVSLTGNFSNFLNLPVQVMDASFLNPMANPGETVVFKAGTDYTTGANLQVNQLIFSGSYIVGIKAAKLFTQFKETQAEQTKEDVLFNVIQAYELAAVASENLKYADSMVASAQTMIDQQQHFLDLKIIVQEDIDQFKLALINAKNAQTNANVQYKNAISLLKYSMGYPADDVIYITETTNDLLAIQNSNSALTNNISQKLMDESIRLQTLNLQNKKAESLPTLGGFFQHGYNAYRNEFNFFANQPWYPQTAWGVQLNVPIFSGSKSTSIAKVELLKLESDNEFLTEALKFQESQGKNKLEAANSQLQLQLENIKLAQSIYNNAITKEDLGKINSLEVTQKQQQLLMAHAQYIGSLVNLFQAKLDLDKLYNNIIPSQK